MIDYDEDEELAAIPEVDDFDDQAKPLNTLTLPENTFNSVSVGR